MIDDVARFIGSTTRAVHSREHEGKPARVVAVSRTFDTSVEDAWEAVTSAERLPRWFLPITGELREGGRYQLQGNAGGTITKCEPPRRFEATWEFSGAVSWIVLRVTDAPGGRATVQLEHIAREDAHWQQFGPGATGVGWDMAILGLTLHLTTGRPKVDPAEAMAWFGSPEGKELVTLSSNDWRRADIESGTDEGTARGMAERTRAAYTGESPNS